MFIINSNSNSNSLLMKTTCWRASKVQTINTQQIYSTQSIKYKTDKLNKAKIIKKTKTKQKSLKKNNKCPTKVILHLR